MRRCHCRSGRPWLPPDRRSPALPASPVLSSSTLVPGNGHGGAYGLSAPRSVPSCPLPAALALKRQVVRVGDRWLRRPLASVLGGLKLDRDIFVALTVSALHGVRPPVDPKTQAADRAAPAQVRVLLSGGGGRS